VIGGLVLALVSAALINLGFLLQHRGLGHTTAAGGALGRLRRSLRNPVWLSGQALGWLGFGLQVVAVAVAPLALVQAFAAGGLALSVPLAAGVFRHRVTRAQMVAVLLIAAGLASLPLGLSPAGDHLDPGRLIAAVAVGSVLAVGLGRVRAPVARAAAAGVFYGLADAAIKAVSLDWHHHGSGSLLSGWALVALAGTFAGFLCFQAALETGAPVPGISVMTAATALVALACGLGAFGESLGAGAVAGVMHGLAIAVVLAAVPSLAAAHTSIVEAADHRDERPPPRPRALPAIGRPR
jgi:drug/metabolite transporter (DMT)-like permease